VLEDELKQLSFYNKTISSSFESEEGLVGGLPEKCARADIGGSCCKQLTGTL
jgi:hypothetical protein